MKANYAIHHPWQTPGGGPVVLAFIRFSDASYAQSQEARMVLAAEKEARQHWNGRTEALIGDIQSAEDFSYNHISPRQVSSVKCQYKYVGRMKPRLFALDE
jgi:hypothetical protein